MTDPMTDTWEPTEDLANEVRHMDGLDAAHYLVASNELIPAEVLRKELEGIKELAEKATSGNWYVAGFHVMTHDDPMFVVKSNLQADAAFIAQSRQTIDSLLFLLWPEGAK